MESEEPAVVAVAKTRLTNGLLTALFVLLVLGVISSIVYNTGSYTKFIRTGTRLADNGFGTISASTSATPSALETATKGSPGSVDSVDMVAPGGVGSQPVPEPNYIIGTDTPHYVYKATGVPAPLAKLDVYHRTATNLSSGLLDVALSKVLNKQKLGSAQLLSLSFALDGSDFMVTTMQDGETNMSSTSVFNLTAPASQPTITQADALQKSKEFLEGMGIDLSQYDAPVFSSNANGLIAVPRAAEDAQVKTEPSSYVTVSYPDVIHGKPVFDQSGNRSGMVVSITGGKVQSVYGITRKSYEYSAYETKSLDDITKTIEAGGVYGQYSANSTTEDVQLGELIQGYIKVSQYTSNKFDTLYLPAYAFKNPKANQSTYYVPEYVVVPLIKGYDSQSQIYPATGAASSGSATVNPAIK